MCRKLFVLFFLFYIIYIIIFALVPYIRQKPVSKTFQQNFQVSKVYGTEKESVDRASIIEDSLSALHYRINLIEQATDTILISSYSIKPDESCKDIFSALYAAANRGVKVKILGDGITSFVHMENNSMYYALASHPNVEIKFYNTIDILRPWRLNARLHDKYLLVDNRYLILGGRNISNYFVGEYNKDFLSYDREMFVYNTKSDDTNDKSSVVYQVNNYFFPFGIHLYQNPPFTNTQRICLKK